MDILNSLLVRILPRKKYLQYRRSRNWKKHAGRIDQVIGQFVGDRAHIGEAKWREWQKKLVGAYVRDNWFPEEYFFFHYENLSPEGIRSFVGQREANLFWNYQNSRDVYLLTCDKGATYQRFGRFFRRELVAVSKDDPASGSAFTSLAERHDRLVIKPNYGNFGNGVRIVRTADTADRHALLERLLADYPDGFAAEEVIVQHPALAALHPSSVNTVRLTTVRLKNGDIYLIHRPFLRIGQGGNCVDNGAKDGIIASIDFETGILYAAIDERMRRYVVHPDTQAAILGFRIPRWEEAKRLAVELAGVLPELGYCGWDLALTEEGWVMVEANGKGLFIGFQMPAQEGFRDEYESIKRQCGYAEKG